jgi:hypothetical protein
LALATHAPYTALAMTLGAGKAAFDLSGITAGQAELLVGTGELVFTTAAAPLAVGALTVTVGTGEATYDLRGVSAGRVNLEVGTGDLTLTTTREPAHAPVSAPSGIGALTVEIGLGNAHMDLRQTRFQSATLSVGMGNLLVDLRGSRPHDAHAYIETGVGNITLIVPEDVGVRVRVHGGIGTVEAGALARLAGPEDADETVYVNPAYATSRVTLDVIAEYGVGNVRLLSHAPAPDPPAQHGGP